MDESVFTFSRNTFSVLNIFYGDMRRCINIRFQFTRHPEVLRHRCIAWLFPTCSLTIESRPSNSGSFNIPTVIKVFFKDS